MFFNNVKRKTSPHENFLIQLAASAGGGTCQAITVAVSENKGQSTLSQHSNCTWGNKVQDEPEKKSRELTTHIYLKPTTTHRFQL